MPPPVLREAQPPHVRVDPAVPPGAPEGCPRGGLDEEALQGREGREEPCGSVARGDPSAPQPDGRDASGAARRRR